MYNLGFLAFPLRFHGDFSLIERFLKVQFESYLFYNFTVLVKVSLTLI